jgi:hypothetical protein
MGTILRYVAPGFIAVAVLHATDNKYNLSPSLLGNPYPREILIAFALIIGPLIYALHANAIIRIIYLTVAKMWIFFSERAREKYKISKNIRMRDKTFEIDSERWKRRGNKDDEVISVQHELDKWADMLNYMYCSSYCLIFIPLYVKIARPISVCNCYWQLILSGSIVLIACLYSEKRLIERDIWAQKEFSSLYNLQKC